MTTLVEVEVKPLDAVGQLLVDAADLIEREGWIQGEFHSSGGYCAIGALSFASHSTLAEVQRAVDRLALTIGHGGITMWNDVAYRTKQEVVDALRKAALTHD